MRSRVTRLSGVFGKRRESASATGRSALRFAWERSCRGSVAAAGVCVWLVWVDQVTGH